MRAWCDRARVTTNDRDDDDDDDERDDDDLFLRVSTTTTTDARARFVRVQNRRNTSGRMELMKYNPFLRKHTLHRELKK